MSDGEGHSFWLGTLLGGEEFHFFKYDGSVMTELTFTDDLNILRAEGKQYNTDEIYFKVVSLTSLGVTKEDIYYLNGDTLESITENLSGGSLFTMSQNQKGLPFMVHQNGLIDDLYFLNGSTINLITLQNGPYLDVRILESVGNDTYIYARSSSFVNLFHIDVNIPVIITPTGSFSSFESGGLSGSEFYCLGIETSTNNKQLFAIDGGSVALIAPNTFNWSSISVLINDDFSLMYFLADRGVKEHIYYNNKGVIEEIQPSSFTWDDISFLGWSEDNYFYFNAVRNAIQRTFSHKGINLSDITNASAQRLPDELGNSKEGVLYVNYNIGNEEHLYYSSQGDFMPTGNSYPDSVSYLHHFDGEYPYVRNANLRRRMGVQGRHYIHDISEDEFMEVITADTIESFLLNYYTGDSFYSANSITGEKVILSGTFDNMIQNTPDFSNISVVSDLGFDSSGRAFIRVSNGTNVQLYKVWISQVNVNDELFNLADKDKVYEAESLLMSDAIITPNSSVIFRSGEQIELYEEFNVPSGTTLEAEIGGCGM